MLFKCFFSHLEILLVTCIYIARYQNHNDGIISISFSPWLPINILNKLYSIYDIYRTRTWICTCTCRSADTDKATNKHCIWTLVFRYLPENMHYHVYTRSISLFSLLFNLPLLLHSRLKKIRRDMACFGNYMTVYLKKKTVY